ncbi:hypothetical protein [Streptomyces diastatochromogenes]|uniref:hypothetical protein n=1 Tax=Streptomyces diastatochromogenes TaxID=42236 RepID=UPI00142D959E|nr:hypothetical protein [Streptomyces diastatochromogenes]MCZ0991434.1 hypothetical protein [Streptomyces diastatochromogenes]
MATFTVPDATVQVSFEVEGAGELVGVANGNPHNVGTASSSRAVAPGRACDRRGSRCL